MKDEGFQETGINFHNPETVCKNIENLRRCYYFSGKNLRFVEMIKTHPTIRIIVVIIIVVYQQYNNYYSTFKNCQSNDFYRISYNKYFLAIGSQYLQLDSSIIRISTLSRAINPQFLLVSKIQLFLEIGSKFYTSVIRV